MCLALLCLQTIAAKALQNAPFSRKSAALYLSWITMPNDKYVLDAFVSGTFLFIANGVKPLMVLEPLPFYPTHYYNNAVQAGRPRAG